MRTIRSLLALALVLSLVLLLGAAALASDEAGDAAETLVEEESAETETAAEEERNLEADEIADPEELPECPEETGETEEEPPAEMPEEATYGEEDAFAPAEDAEPDMGAPYVLPDIGDNDTLYEAYIAQTFGLESGLALDREPVDSGSQLAGAERALYQILRGMIEEIASGKRTSTEFRIPVTYVLDRTSWTAEELGVLKISSGGSLTKAAQQAVENRIGIYLWDVVTRLMVDCPCEMYWFDKTSEDNEVTWPTPYLDGSVARVDGDYVFTLAVAPEYQAGGQPYKVDASYGSTVQKAASNALAIVEENRNKSDYDKLEAYVMRICELNTYNNDAGTDDSMPYGNPWQLLWVFDGDPDTNVVCEGYSKAFQYLCDLTEFNSPEICCYAVWGNYNYGTDAPGGHMWNIVRMDDGRNYLVDVTNCDLDEDGIDHGLFLKGCACGSLMMTYYIDSGYEYYDCYAYDYDIWEAYTAEQLLLASSDYGRDGFVVPASGVPIDEEHFPSETLREYLSYYFDWEDDGYLSALELADITFLDIEDFTDSIHTLQGIESFPDLKVIYVSGNDLTELDVSGNARLEMLDCRSNSLTELDISRNPALMYADCSDNSLTEISVGSHPDLVSFYCEDNGIRQIDISLCPKLLDICRRDEVWEYGAYTVYGQDPGTYDELWDFSFDTGVLLITENSLDINRDGFINAADAAVFLAMRDTESAAAVLLISVNAG